MGVTANSSAWPSAKRLLFGSCFGGSGGACPGGVTVDAEKLAHVIESLARFGQRTTAVNAVDIASKLECLSFLLGCEVDSFFAT